jgi:transposase
LGVEIATADCFLEAHPTLKADGVALAIHHMAQQLQAQGFQKIICYLDQSSTHKTLMKYNLALLTHIPIEIRYLPPYSPKLNVVEFLIHLVRLKKLHHAPHTRDLTATKQELEHWIQQQPFEAEKLHNIIDHILKKHYKK